MSKFLVSLKQLEKWFEQNKRVLPWRNDPSVYRVWISEIMLQQTQVVTVIPYFEKFIAKFPTVENLAQAGEEEVMHFWAGLGYYSRARNLHKGALKVIQAGRFPQTREEWLEIPGVGNYTAGAILSIALDQPEAILDGNVERVLTRLRRVSRKWGDTAFKTRLWKVSRILVETAHRNGVRPSIVNQALMELGATLCTPRSPQCNLCPIRSLCRADQRNDTENFPPKKKAKKWVQVDESVSCILNSSGQVLLRRREVGEWRAGLWDLPTINEIEPPKIQLLGEIETKHIVTHHKIRRKTQVWMANSRTGANFWSAAEPSPFSYLWISIQDPEVPVGSALKRTLNAVQERFGKTERTRKQSER